MGMPNLGYSCDAPVGSPTRLNRGRVSPKVDSEGAPFEHAQLVLHARCPRGFLHGYTVESLAQMWAPKGGKRGPTRTTCAAPKIALSADVKNIYCTFWTFNIRARLNFISYNREF